MQLGGCPGVRPFCCFLCYCRIFLRTRGFPLWDVPYNVRRVCCIFENSVSEQVDVSSCTRSERQKNWPRSWRSRPFISSRDSLVEAFCSGTSFQLCLCKAYIAKSLLRIRTGVGAGKAAAFRFQGTASRFEFNTLHISSCLAEIHFRAHQLSHRTCILRHSTYATHTTTPALHGNTTSPSRALHLMLPRHSTHQMLRRGVYSQQKVHMQAFPFLLVLTKSSNAVLQTAPATNLNTMQVQVLCPNMNIVQRTIKLGLACLVTGDMTPSGETIPRCNVT